MAKEKTGKTRKQVLSAFAGGENCLSSCFSGFSVAQPLLPVAQSGVQSTDDSQMSMKRDSDENDRVWADYKDARPPNFEGQIISQSRYIAAG